MNCYNGEKYLHEAIDSVYAQTYENWEIIFWDNASTDNSAKIAKSYDSKLKYYCGDDNIPLGAARNKALEQCRGEYIAFLDVDDLWLPEKLEKQIPLFIDNDVVLVYCDSYSFNNNGVRKKLSDSKIFMRGMCFDKLLLNYFLVLSSVVVRKVTLLTNNIIFNSYFEMVEEADVFLQLSYYGKIDFVDKVLANWRSHNQSTTWTKYNLLYQESIKMKNKLICQFPDIIISYKSELAQFDLNIIKLKIIDYWLESENSSMRVFINKNISILPFFNIIAFYILSFLNAKRWSKIVFAMRSSIVAPS